MRNGVTSNTVEVAGLNIHYLSAGEGEPVVLLHGWPTSSFLWRNVMVPIAASNRAIAPDLPGFGRSDKPLDAISSFRFHQKVLDGFLDALGIDTAGLAVHDLGGPIGLYWARRRLRRCLHPAPGGVVVLRDQRGRPVQILARLGAGELFGELGVIGPPVPGRDGAGRRDGEHRQARQLDGPRPRTPAGAPPPAVEAGAALPGRRRHPRGLRRSLEGYGRPRRPLLTAAAPAGQPPSRLLAPGVRPVGANPWTADHQIRSSAIGLGTIEDVERRFGIRVLPTPR